MIKEELKKEFVEGKILLFNKPLNWTSFDIVKKIKATLKYKYGIKKIKVGHAGTLDPLAEGLMIIAIGKATKKLPEIQDYDKEYVATFELGKSSPSFDLETPIEQVHPIEHVNKEKVILALKEFEGKQEQIPPLFSAKKINGKRAYEFARKNEIIELKPAQIVINEIKLMEYDLPYIKLFISCSKGTYIRSLARDVGEKLNCGAQMIKLTRTAIGTFKLENAEDISLFGKDET